MQFDAEAFQNSVISDANSTATIPWPQAEYVGTIKKAEIRSGTISKGDRAGQPWAGLSVQVEVDRSFLPDGASSVASGMIMLDLTDAGGLDSRAGRNVNLGRLREAVGLNVPGQPFSFPMLEGRTVKITTGVRVDKNDTDLQYTEIKGFKAP
jgi:hypothetical protein